MATTTRITSIATKYGTKSYGTLGSVYVGAGYRTRATFPAIRSNAAIGDANIVISKVLLHMRRDSGGATTVNAGCSTNSGWGAAVDASGSGTIPASTGWHTIDITACAQYLLEYTGNWHLHLTGSGTRVRCNGAGSGSDPCIDIVWEYAASTITTGTETSELGKTINFTIKPKTGDAKYALSYSFGSESGNIAETTATSIKWTPPLAFATEIPNAEIGEMKVTMRVYGSDGKQIRSEVLFVTVTVPESAKLKFSGNRFASVNALVYSYNSINYAALLTGKSSYKMRPVLDITGAYGASIASVRAEINNEGITQTLEWTEFTETDAGIFEGSVAKATSIFQKAGTAKVTMIATDSRGREISEERTFNVYTYANPAITAFSVERYEPVYDANEQISGYAPSDVGENVWVTLKASCSNIVAHSASRNFLSWKITAVSSDGKKTTYSGNSGTAQSVSMENNRALISAVIPAANAVDYTVEVSDTAGYKAYQYDSVAPGRANFALAGSKWGAAFGCMPKGTEDNPMLETAYPIYAYGGIDGVTNYTQGEVKTPYRWIDGKPIYRYIVQMTSTSTGDVFLGNLPQTPDKIIGMYGSWKCNGMWHSFPFAPFDTLGRAGTLLYSINTNRVLACIGASNSGEKEINAVIEYTKTTDAESHQAFVDAAGNYLVTADGYQYMTKNMEV